MNGRSSTSRSPAFQLTQTKLADMTLELGKGMLLALHLGRLKDAGQLRPEQVSLGKLNNVREAIAHRPRVPHAARRGRHHAGVPRSCGTPTTWSRC